MAASSSPAATMKLVGGDPCLDFVNSVGGRAAARVRADKLASYEDLVAFARHAGLANEATGRALRRLAEADPLEARGVLARAVALREALYRTLCSLMQGRRPAAEDLGPLNAELAACRSQEVLSPAPRGLRLAWRTPERRLDSPLWPVARAAAALVVSPEIDRLRQCGGEDCGWLFLDRSRNRSRLWCTMEDCGNLSKVRRFRERHARPPGA